MNNDLISREAVAEKMKNRRDYVGRPSDPDCIIADEPTVSAVPLDKVCKFLGKATQPCILLAIGCPYDESNCEECDSCNAWKATLTKWMEKQNA